MKAPLCWLLANYIPFGLYRIVEPDRFFGSATAIALMFHLIISAILIGVVAMIFRSQAAT